MTYLDNRERERCYRCEKLIFRNEPDADAVAASALTRGVNLRVYFEDDCSGFHLSSQPKRGVARPTYCQCQD